MNVVRKVNDILLHTQCDFRNISDGDVCVIFMIFRYDFTSYDFKTEMCLNFIIATYYVLRERIYISNIHIAMIVIFFLERKR